MPCCSPEGRFCFNRCSIRIGVFMAASIQLLSGIVMMVLLAIDDNDYNTAGRVIGILMMAAQIVGAGAVVFAVNSTHSKRYLLFLMMTALLLVMVGCLLVNGAYGIQVCLRLTGCDMAACHEIYQHEALVTAMRFVCIVISVWFAFIYYSAYKWIISQPPILVR